MSGGTPDVVVVGAGSAGCVLARAAERTDRPHRAAPGGRARLPDGRRPAHRRRQRFQRGREPRLGIRRVSPLRAVGRLVSCAVDLVGGCSALNATLAPRGFPADYDAVGCARESGLVVRGGRCRSSVGRSRTSTSATRPGTAMTDRSRSAGTREPRAKPIQPGGARVDDRQRVTQRVDDHNEPGAARCRACTDQHA